MRTSTTTTGHRRNNAPCPLLTPQCGQSRAARAGRTAEEWRTALNWSEPVELGAFYRYAFAKALHAVGLPVTTPARAEHRHGDDTIEPARPATQGVRPHDLRHSAAVAWLTAGVPVVQVSRWLGHAQPTITLNVYGDWVPETVENPLPEPWRELLASLCATEMAVQRRKGARFGEAQSFGERRSDCATSNGASSMARRRATRPS